MCARNRCSGMAVTLVTSGLGVYVSLNRYPLSLGTCVGVTLNQAGQMTCVYPMSILSNTISHASTSLNNVLPRTPITRCTYRASWSTSKMFTLSLSLFSQFFSAPLFQFLRQHKFQPGHPLTAGFLSFIASAHLLACNLTAVP